MSQQESWASPVMYSTPDGHESIEMQVNRNVLSGRSNLVAGNSVRDNSHNNIHHDRSRNTTIQAIKQKETNVKLLIIALSIISLTVIAVILTLVFKLAIPNGSSNGSSSSGSSSPLSSTQSLLSTNSQNTTSSDNHQISETVNLVALPSSTSTSSSQSKSTHSTPAPSLSQQPPSTLTQSLSPQPSSVIAPSSTSVPTKVTPTLSAQTTPTRAPSSSSIAGLAAGFPCTADNQCRSPNGCYTYSGTTTTTFCGGPEYPGCPGSPCSAYDAWIRTAAAPRPGPAAAYRRTRASRDRRAMREVYTSVG